MSVRKFQPGSLPAGVIESRALTTCEISQDGTAVRLHFTDQAGAPAALDLPFDQAQSIVMTLPGLLAAALQVRTGNTGSRYVFPLDRWSLELSNVRRFLLLSLRTSDGFEVSFSLPVETCQELAMAMRSGCQTIVGAGADAAKAH
jgi:hypothetical protein